MPRSAPRETPLEMLRRHVAESEDRLARQERLIGKLERDGHTAMLPDAHAFLEQLRDFLRLAREHLAYEMAKSERGKTG